MLQAVHAVEPECLQPSAIQQYIHKVKVMTQKDGQAKQLLFCLQLTVSTPHLSEG